VPVSNSGRQQLHKGGVPELSVVVASYNGARYLPDCLASLCEQEGCPRLEIIVVDDGSTDDTWKQIEKFDVLGVRLPENRGLSAARNAGVARATGPVVAFVDDDMVAPPGWAARIASFWRNAPPEVAILCGIASPLAVDTFNRRFARWHRPIGPVDQLPDGMGQIAGRFGRYLRSLSSPTAGSSRSVARPAGGAMSIRTSDMADLGGFVEDIRFGGEDDELAIRVLHRYGPNSIWFDPSMEILHDFDASFRSTLRRFRLYGLGQARLQATEGGVPPLQPMPLFCLAAALGIGLLRPRWAIAGALVVPYALSLPRLLPALRRDGLVSLAYPLALLSLEAAADVGLVRGLLGGVGPRPGDRSAGSPSNSIGRRALDGPLDG
jgi:glycosyltransferase involved in cell wall biosynthesis